MIDIRKSKASRSTVVLFALLATSLGGCILEANEPINYPPRSRTQTCCDCACSDGTNICLNVVETAPVGASCDTVCEVECSEQEGCDQVADAQVCTAAPPRPCASATSSGDTAPGDMEPCT
jgi:hypothetical protein